MDERVTDFKSASPWNGALRAEWRVNGRRMVAEWHGGAYIDVGNYWGHAFEVFNVWDFAKGAATIPHTREALTRYLRGKLSDEETVTNLIIVKENTR